MTDDVHCVNPRGPCIPSPTGLHQFSVRTMRCIHCDAGCRYDDPYTEPEMNDRDLLEAMDAICRHQTNHKRHPLTCGKHSNHPPLFPVVNDKRAIELRCAACDYVQSWFGVFRDAG